MFFDYSFAKQRDYFGVDHTWLEPEMVTPAELNEISARIGSRRRPRMSLRRGTPQLCRTPLQCLLFVVPGTGHLNTVRKESEREFRLSRHRRCVSCEFGIMAALVLSRSR